MTKDRMANSTPLCPFSMEFITWTQDWQEIGLNRPLIDLISTIKKNKLFTSNSCSNLISFNKSAPMKLPQNSTMWQNFRTQNPFHKLVNWITYNFLSLHFSNISALDERTTRDHVTRETLWCVNDDCARNMIRLLSVIQTSNAACAVRGVSRGRKEVLTTFYKKTRGKNNSCGRKRNYKWAKARRQNEIDQTHEWMNRCNFRADDHLKEVHSWIIFAGMFSRGNVQDRISLWILLRPH